MNCNNAIKSNRKSGVAKWRDLQCALRLPEFLGMSATLTQRAPNKLDKPYRSGKANAMYDLFTGSPPGSSGPSLGISFPFPEVAQITMYSRPSTS
jgi:hypothetical protein